MGEMKKLLLIMIDWQWLLVSPFRSHENLNLELSGAWKLLNDKIIQILNIEDQDLVITVDKITHKSNIDDLVATIP